MRLSDVYYITRIVHKAGVVLCLVSLLRVASLAPWQPPNCLGASEATLTNGQVYYMNPPGIVIINTTI